MSEHEQSCCCPGDTRTAAKSSDARSGDAALRRDVFRIDNMDCPTEEGLIRTKLSGLAGIAALEFNLMQRKLTVAHNLEDGAPILASLREIGMNAIAESTQTAVIPTSGRQTVASKQWWSMGLAGACAVTAEVVAWVSGDESSVIVIALALLAVASGGFHTYKKGWIALKNRNLNINALMSIAVTGAMLIGQWPEAAMVMFLFALAEMIETLSLDRARNAIHGLLAMAPEIATVHQPDGTWKEVEAKHVTVGARVRVKPGERIALDGTVMSGQSSVNQAPITGESIPVGKTAGDPVFAGTINENGSLEYCVTAAATHSMLARIIKAVEQAQANRAPTQRFVDRFAKIYTPIVVLVAVLVALVPPLVFGLPWMDWIYTSLVLLVIACPCALVIATPVTVVSALAAAASHGILIKGGAYLEDGHRLKALAFDKTGTITRGRPSVVDVQVLPGTDLLRVMQLAASLAVRSDHPVSRAVGEYVADTTVLQEVEEFAAIPGRGIKGRIGNELFYLGNHRLVEDLHFCSPQLESRLEILERKGYTAVTLFGAGGVHAVFGVADTIRDTSLDALADLHALGMRTVMLTGDNARTADTIAKNVGIDDVRAELTPLDKLEAIAGLHAQGLVGMIGDGINDAPALAKADIGFAMGAAGTDTAIETADVALMDDDLRKIPQFIRLSRATASILVQNIVIALGIKAVFLVLALIGEATLWMAVFADMGASLLVVFNGLRLLRFENSPAVASTYQTRAPTGAHAG